MSRTTWLGLLVAAVLVAAALWMLRPRGRGGASGGAVGTAREQGPGLGRGGGGGGVRAAEVDLDASVVVRGEVVDADGDPVTDGALLLRCLRGDTVTVLGTVRLDAEGAFEGPGCRGQVCATLQHASQSPAEPWVLRAGTTTILRSESLDRLWGEVVTPGGDPVEGARVTFVQAGDDPDPTALPALSTRSTTTDADGRFSASWIRRPPCGPCEEATGGCAALPPMVEDLVAIASAPGHASGRASFDRATQTGADAPLRVTMQRAEDLLTGQLLGPEGVAYARAFVLARSVDRPREQRRAEVDADGNFEVDGLGPGEHALRAIQDGTELATGKAHAGEDVELTGSVSAQGPDLEIVVLGEDGRFAAGAVVDGGPFRGTKTDMKGSVRAPAALPGPVGLRIRALGRTERFEVEIPRRPPDEPAHSHRVQLRLGAREPHDQSSPGL